MYGVAESRSSTLPTTVASLFCYFATLEGKHGHGSIDDGYHVDVNMRVVRCFSFDVDESCHEAVLGDHGLDSIEPTRCPWTAML